MNIKFALNFLLTISAFAFSMQQDEMTVLKKWEDAKPFVGRVIAHAPVSECMQSEEYKLNENNDLRYAYIGKFHALGQCGYFLHPLKKPACGKYYYLALSNSALAAAPYLFRLANLEEIIAIREAIQSDKAVLNGCCDKDQAYSILEAHLAKLRLGKAS